MWKIIKIVIGVFLIMGSLNGLSQLVKNFPSGSAEYNLGYIAGSLTVTLLFLGIGGYLIYSATKSNNSLPITESADEKTKIDEKRKETE